MDAENRLSKAHWVTDLTFSFLLSMSQYSQYRVLASHPKGDVVIRPMDEYACIGGYINALLSGMSSHVVSAPLKVKILSILLSFNEIRYMSKAGAGHEGTPILERWEQRDNRV